METLVREVLTEWRQAERVAAESQPGSEEYHEALVAADRLHAVYQEMLWDGVTDETERQARRALAETNLPASHSWSDISGS